MPYARRMLPAGLLSLAALAACTDQLDAPTAATAPPAAASPVLTDGGLRDPAIDMTDTYFSADITTSTSVDDGEAAALAESITSVASFQEGAYVEGGFGRDGAMRFNVWFSNPEDGAVQMVGDRINLLDASGRVTASHTIEYAASVAGLPSFSTVNAYFVSSPPVCDPTYPECASLDASAMALGPADQDVRELRMRGGAGAENAGRSEVVQRYRRVRRAGPEGAEQWQLEEVRSTRRVKRGGRDADVTTVTRLKYRQWNRDERRDATREQRQRRTSRSARSSGGMNASPLPALPPTPSVASIAALEPTRNADQSANLIGGACARGTFNLDTTRASVTRGHSVVYQHGFCSNASIWPAFDQVLSRSVPIQRSQAYSLESTSRVESQATELASRIFGKFPRPLLFIGHSQGGLVVRRVAQMQQELTTGVITIGTPHLGAPLADAGPELVSAALVNAVLSDSCNAPWVCGLVAEIISERLAGQNSFGIDGLAPSLKDLRTQSEIQRQLNATRESFPRVSIETQIPRRWGIVRYLFDARSPSSRLLSGDRPAGDAAVTMADFVYKAAALTRFLSLVAMYNPNLQGGGVNCSNSVYTSLWPGCTDPFAYTKVGNTWYTAYLLAISYDLSTRIMELMNSIDRTWYELASGGEGQYDGLVPARSQRYPNVPGTFEPFRLTASGSLADSHSAQIKSPFVVTLTIDAISFINNRVFVP